MPTDYGFTGQHSDAATGLDYYNARYYDPLAGQFTSADPVLPDGGFGILGLSRYAYVEGNPETLTDPSGDTACRAGHGCGMGWSGEDDPVAAAQPAVWNYSPMGGTVQPRPVYHFPSPTLYRANLHIASQEQFLIPAKTLDRVTMNWHHDPVLEYIDQAKFQGFAFQNYNRAGNLYGAVLWTLGMGGIDRLGSGGEDDRGSAASSEDALFWEGYPEWAPKPTGQFTVRSGDDLETARETANTINRRLHIEAGDDLSGYHIHEILPVKFGGSPTDLENKIALPADMHYELNSWWYRLQRDLGEA
jgi:RHS repeat-associated protein